MSQLKAITLNVNESKMYTNYECYFLFVIDIEYVHRAHNIDLKLWLTSQLTQVKFSIVLFPNECSLVAQQCFTAAALLLFSHINAAVLLSFKIIFSVSNR